MRTKTANVDPEIDGEAELVPKDEEVIEDKKKKGREEEELATQHQ